jgi:hypothetical protein
MIRLPSTISSADGRREDWIMRLSDLRRQARLIELATYRIDLLELSGERTEATDKGLLISIANEEREAIARELANFPNLKPYGGRVPLIPDGKGGFIEF